MHVLSAIISLSSITYAATAYNLSESYAPVRVGCPSDITYLRSASEGLNPDEETWLHGRKQVVVNVLKEYLQNAKLKNFDINDYISRLKKTNTDAVPGIGLAVSGGGYASAFMGAGIARALDGREPESVQAGTGGLLQAMSFMSGQSGGSWVVSTEIANSLPIAEDLLEYWQPRIDRLSVKTNGTHAATIAHIGEDIVAKYKADFNVSVADLLGRIQSYEWVMGPNGGLNATMSNLKELSRFQNHEMPLPIIEVCRVSKGDPVQQGLLIPNIKSPMYEFTPWEFGTWMDENNSFMDMKYLGTSMINGQPMNNSECVIGFDRISWIIGASANAFEFWYLKNHSNGTLGQFPKRSDLEDTLSATFQSLRQRSLPPDLHEPAKRLLETFPGVELEGLAEPFVEGFHLDLQDYAYTPVPNPWINTSTAANPGENLLHVVDATEAASSLPLAGQLARNATFILAWDDNSDAWPYGWVNGTSMYQAYQYFKLHGIPFPVVPRPQTFIIRNYTVKPVFFGCEANQTTTNTTQAPIIAWFPNAPYSSYSNITFFENVTPVERVRDLWNNTFNEITQGAGKLDSEWAACLACAAIDRSVEKVGIQRSTQCQGCFERYCWDGTEEVAEEHMGAQQSLLVDPRLLLDETVSFEEWNATTHWG